MKTNGHQTLVPQAEEDISELRWIGPLILKSCSGNVSAIIEVLRAGGLLV